MGRFITTLAVALSFAGAGALHAQDTIKSQTKIEADHAKTVTFTGCLETGAETQSYILDKVVPTAQTSRTEVGTSGPETTTTTTYTLIPGEKVDFHEHVGHKVEVTGVLLSGDMKTETKTTVEPEHGKDMTTKETSKVNNALPQLRVTSVKHLAGSCAM